MTATDPIAIEPSPSQWRRRCSPSCATASSGRSGLNLPPGHLPAGRRTDPARARRSWLQRHRWSVTLCGGHFAALEEPRLLAEEVREFFRPLRAVTR